MELHSFKRHLISEPDRLIAAVFAMIGLSGLTLTLLGGRSFVIQASIIAFASILYLVLSQRKKEKTQPTSFPAIALAPVFLGVFGMGVLAYLYLPFNVTLGLAIISFSGTLILVQICIMDPVRIFGHKALILAETFLLSLFLRLLPSLSNPGFPGIDPWGLSATSVEILKMGRAMPHSTYGDFPIYNILVSVGSIMTSIDARTSTLLMIGFAQAFSIFFVYLVAKAVWNYNVGLIASLFYALTPSSIFWGAYPIPMSIGITLTIFLTGLLLQSAKSGSSLPYRSLACLLVITVVLTHTITSVIIIVILVAMALSTYLLKLTYKPLSSQDILLRSTPKFNVIAILAFFSTLAYWVYVATGFFSTTAVSLASILGVYYPKDFIIPSYVVPVSLIKLFFDDLGLITFYSFAVVGLFLVFSRGETKSAFFILAMTGVLYGVSVLLPFLGIVSGSSILLERWEPFLFAFLVCLSARALQYIRSRFSIRTAVAVFVIVGVLMIPSVVSYNPENLDRYFSPTFFLSSEISAAEWTKGCLSSQDIASDARYSVVLGREAKDFGHQIISGNITQVVKSLPNTVLLVSTYSFRGGRIIYSYERETLGWGGATLKLPYDIDSFLDNPYYNRLFSNGIVNSYG